jgi:DNA repair exonuclease SbcCD ATPase subunit
VLINIIPNPHQAEVDRQVAVRKEIARQTEQVQKVKNELAKKNEKAPSARREEGIKALEDLQQQLDRTKQPEQAMKALAHTQDKLKKLSLQEDVNSDLQSLSQGLKQAEISKEMGDKLAGGDSKEIEQSFKRMAERIPSMAASDRQNLSASLSQAAAAINNEGLRNQLNQVAASLNRGSAKAAASKLSALGATLGQMSEQSAVNADLVMAQTALQLARTGIAAASSGSGASMASTAGTSCQHPECNVPGGNG